MDKTVVFLRWSFTFRMPAVLSAAPAVQVDLTLAQALAITSAPMRPRGRDIPRQRSIGRAMVGLKGQRMSGWRGAIDSMQTASHRIVAMAFVRTDCAISNNNKEMPIYFLLRHACRKPIKSLSTVVVVTRRGRIGDAD